MTTMQGILTLAISAALAGCATDNVAWRSPSQADTTGYQTNYPAVTATSPTGLPDNPQVGANDKERSLGQISSADMAFIRDAESGNQFEISAAQKALVKSSDPQIKSMAQHMSDDHEKANSQLINLASRLGLADTSSLSVDQINMLAQLDSLNGTDFDHQYVSQQIAAHKETIGKFQAAANDADSKDLRDWASATLPTLQNHLSMLQSESQTLGNVDNSNNAGMTNNPGNMNSPATNQ